MAKKELKVEYEILSIDKGRKTAKVRFSNPFNKGKNDEVNVPHERDVKIPMKDGKGNSEEFKTILEQLCMGQLNKMRLKFEEDQAGDDAIDALVEEFGVKEVTDSLADDSVEEAPADEPSEADTK
jgi:hypothetical protein